MRRPAGCIKNKRSFSSTNSFHAPLGTHTTAQAAYLGVGAIFISLNDQTPEGSRRLLRGRDSKLREGSTVPESMCGKLEQG